MPQAKLLYDEKVQFLQGRFEVRIIVYEVTKSNKFSEGIKLSCVLLDCIAKVPKLLLDNHEPFGYHLHTEMPHNKNYRVPLEVKNYEEAIRFFMKEVTKVINEKI